MMAHTGRERPDVLLKPFFDQGTLIFDQRTRLARECLRQRCDYALWLDTDMTFPPDTLLLLLGHGADIVAANCTTRSGVIAPVSVSMVDGQWVRVPTLPDSTGLQEVMATGLAVMLTSARVLRALDTLDRPMFWFEIRSDSLPQTEDFYFCDAARQQGFAVWIDHDLSKEVRHIGSFPFGHEHVAKYPSPRLEALT